jgi:hypothetical protein
MTDGADLAPKTKNNEYQGKKDVDYMHILRNKKENENHELLFPGALPSETPPKPTPRLLYSHVKL